MQISSAAKALIRLIFRPSAPGDLGTTGLIVGQLGIDGGEGPNRLFIGHRLGFAVDATISADQITGYTPEAITYAGDFAGFDGQAGIEIQGSDLGSDSFEIQRYSCWKYCCWSLAAWVTKRSRFAIPQPWRRDRRRRVLARTPIEHRIGQFNRNVDVIWIAVTDDSLDRLSIRATDLADTLSIQNNRLECQWRNF